MKKLRNTQPCAALFLSLLLCFCLFSGGCTSTAPADSASLSGGSASALRIISAGSETSDAAKAASVRETAAEYEPEEEFTEGESTFEYLDAMIQSRLTVDLIQPSEYSRPQEALSEVRGVAVHYLANPGTTAAENRDYFDSLAVSGETYASCHFVIGLEGEIIQLIPLDEISYCTNERNVDTISIECCHPDDSGYYNDATYESLVLLTAWLLEQYDLSYTDIIRHFDANGKICPLAFVVDPDYYYSFKTDVANAMGLDVTVDEVRSVCGDVFLTQEEVDEEYREESEYDPWYDDYADYPPYDFGPRRGRHGE